MALQPHSSGVKIQDLMLDYQRYIQDESSKIIAINLDTSSDNSSSDSDNNTSNSASTSQINTFEEIDYDSLEYKEIIAINLDTSSDNSSSDSDNNTSNSASTSQINTFEEIDYDSLEYKEGKEQAFDASSKVKVQVCGLKVKVQTSGSKAKLQTLPKTLIVKSHVLITNCIRGLANTKTWDAVLKIPPTITCVEEKKGKSKISSGS
nr:hypothetical protein [Tanacetum cinerariifolium]